MTRAEQEQEQAASSFPRCFGAAARDPRQAGLFHTAFLLPSRQDLARWVRRAIEHRMAIDGASDHIVSEEMTAQLEADMRAIAADVS